jgi:hypothetical protein
LYRPILHESILQGIEAAFPGKSFYGQNALAPGPDSEDQAGKNSFPVYDDGAGPAFAFATALFGSRQAELISQYIGQSPVRFDKEIVYKAVNLQLNLSFQKAPPVKRSNPFS